MRKRGIAALIAAGIVVALAPLGAQATHCASNVVIFSGIRGVPKANSNAAVCTLDPEGHDYDGRIINPGSNEISLRYTVDLGESTPTITAVLNGLGFDNQQVVLTRAPFTTGGFVYNSTAIPLDQTQTGCITASVPSVEESNTFHTVGSFCDDF